MSPTAFNRRRAGIGLLLLASALYLPRLNGDWYYLYGEEATGLTLVMSLAGGQGYSDLSLPGAPPHVREPFLFYLLVAGLARRFGFNLWVFKGFTLLPAILSGPLLFTLFRRLAPPRVALSAAGLALAVPALVDYAAQFRPDLWAAALSLAALLCLEKYREEASPITTAGLAGAGLLLAAYFVRSTGLAIALAWPLALMLQPGAASRHRLKLAQALVILAPFFLGFSLWEFRNHTAAARSGLTYAGRYLLGAEPDTLTIMAEDFHAPLHPPWPRATPAQLGERIVRQINYYGRATLHLALNRPPDSVLGPGSKGLALLLLLLFLSGYALSEWNRRSVSSLSLLIYLFAVSAWPMRAPRQVFFFLPFIYLYSLLSLNWLVHRLPLPTWRRFAAALFFAVVSGGMIYYLYGDIKIFRQAGQIATLPRLEIRPGLSARILSPGRMDSARVLLWARDHLPPHSLLMFHSPPPCYLITNRQCSSLPYEPDQKKVRDYLRDSPVEFVILDGWEREFPGGPAQFAVKFLLPALRAYPDDFELIYRDEFSPAAIYRVKKISPPPKAR